MMLCATKKNWSILICQVYYRSLFSNILRIIHRYYYFLILFIFNSTIKKPKWIFWSLLVHTELALFFLSFFLISRTRLYTVHWSTRWQFVSWWWSWIINRCHATVGFVGLLETRRQLRHWPWHRWLVRTGLRHVWQTSEYTRDWCDSRCRWLVQRDISRKLRSRWNNVNVMSWGRWEQFLGLSFVPVFYEIVRWRKFIVILIWCIYRLIYLSINISYSCWWSISLLLLSFQQQNI